MMGNYGQGNKVANPMLNGMQQRRAPQPQPQPQQGAPAPYQPNWQGMPKPTVGAPRPQGAPPAAGNPYMMAPAQGQQPQPQPPAPQPPPPQAPPPANASAPAGTAPATTQPATQNPPAPPPPGQQQSMPYTPRKEYQTKEGTKYRTLDYGGGGEQAPAGWGMQRFNPQTQQWEDAAQTMFGNGGFANFQQFHQNVGNADFSTDAGVQAWMDRMNALSGQREGQRQLYTTGEGNQYRTYNMPGAEGGAPGGWGMETWDPTTGTWKNVAEQAFGQGNPYSNFEQFHAAIGNADFSTNDAVQKWLEKLQASQSIFGARGSEPAIDQDMMARSMFRSDPRTLFRQ